MERLKRERLKIPFQGAIQTVHLVVQNAALRDNVPEVAATLYPGDPAKAAPLLAVYRAALGSSPDAAAALEVHAAYMQYLADLGRFDLVGSYSRGSGLARETRRGCELKAIELYAEAGQVPESEKARLAFAPAGHRGGGRRGACAFRGRMDSVDVLARHPKGELCGSPYHPPCVMATAIMEWALTPNRSQRGCETPWDLIATRYAGGFENLPLPKSAIVGDAASTLKPY